MMPPINKKDEYFIIAAMLEDEVGPRIVTGFDPENGPTLRPTSQAYRNPAFLKNITVYTSKESAIRVANLYQKSLRDMGFEMEANSLTAVPFGVTFLPQKTKISKDSYDRNLENKQKQIDKLKLEVELLRGKLLAASKSKKEPRGKSRAGVEKKTPSATGEERVSL